jgi:hypothetical protein
MRRNGPTTLAPLAAVLLASALTAAPALAEPPGKPGMGMHPGMHSGMGMGAMHGGRMGGHGDGMKGHRFGPHNAAVHFIGMADTLGLDDGQVARLREMRDAWIEANSAKQARLKAAESDLKRLLMADDIQMKEVDAELSLIGRIEGPLWRDFAVQLKDIKDLLSKDQKAKLRERHRRWGM